MNDLFKVGDWLIEPKLLRISKGSEFRKMEFMTMKVLLCLVSNRGKVVSKQQLQEEVWGDVYVSDNTITRSISKIRKVFKDENNTPLIETISKSGYRLIAPIEYKTHNNLKVKSNNANPTQITSGLIRVGIGLSIIIFLLLIYVFIYKSNNDIYSGFFDSKPVSTLLGPELGLAISPDGEKISFSYLKPNTNNVDIYIKLLDDLSQEKFSELDSQQAYGIWSPDSNYMAYVSTEDETCGIYKKPSFGGEKTRIGDCFKKPEDLVWSPDGKIIAFTDISPEYKNRKIFLLDTSSNKVHALFPLNTENNERDPVFHPNGRHLIYRRSNVSSGQDIFKLNLIDKGITQLTFDNSRILGLDIFDNGKQVVFSSDRAGTWALWKIKLNSRKITRFFINDRIPTEPKFSLNGKRMVYRSLRDQTRIWMINKNDSEYDSPIHLASSSRSEIQARISNDGEKVVFISDRSGFFEIWMQDINGDNIRKLTSLEGKYVNLPSFSPDNSEVVFDARIDGDNNVYLLDIATKSIRTFVQSEADQVNARFSRDGKRIYFASNHTGKWQIWQKEVYDSTNVLTQVTKNGGYYLQEGINDSYLYYTRFDTSGIWRINKKTNNTEELFNADLKDYDWGNWIPIKDSIIYLKRLPILTIVKQPYNIELPQISISHPNKRLQSWTSSLSADDDGSKISYVQIEQSEDEIMMVDFK